MELVIGISVLVFSAILHEIMHGYTADKLGDPTARVMGRLTLNPIPHIDPLMSIIIPIILVISGSPIIFGAAKPVPVNPTYFKDRKKDMALVGLAGPLTNIFLAILGALCIKLFPGNNYLNSIFFSIVLTNLSLGIVNLIPIPPLDGSKVLGAFLSDRLATSYYALNQFGIFLLFFLLSFPIGGFSLGSFISKLIYSALRILTLIP